MARPASVAPPKKLMGNPYEGPVPSFIEDREAKTAKSGIRIQRIKEGWYVRNLYIGSKEQLLASGLFLVPQEVRFPISNRHPIKPRIGLDSPCPGYHALYPFGESIYCLSIEERLPRTSSTPAPGVERFEYEKAGDHGYRVVFLGSKEALLDASVAEEDDFPDDPDCTGTEECVDVGGSHIRIRESTRMDDGRYCIHVYLGAQELADRERERESEKSATRFHSADAFRRSLLAALNIARHFVKRHLECEQQGPTTYKLGGETIDAVMEGFAEIASTIEDATIKHVNAVSNVGSPAVRQALTAAESDKAFQRFLGGLKPN